jgi:hypothetical protein
MSIRTVVTCITAYFSMLKPFQSDYFYSDVAGYCVDYYLLFFWGVWSICNECQLEMNHCTKDLSVIVIAVGQRGVPQGARPGFEPGKEAGMRTDH